VRRIWMAGLTLLYLGVGVLIQNLYYKSQVAWVLTFPHKAIRWLLSHHHLLKRTKWFWAKRNHPNRQWNRPAVQVRSSRTQGFRIWYEGYEYS